MPVRAMVAPERVILEAIERAYGPSPVKRERAGVALAGAEPKSAPIPLAEDPAPAGLDELTGFLDESPRAAPRRAVKPMSREQLTARLAAATQEEPILLTALEFVAQHVGGAALFLLRSGDLTGFNAIGLDLAVTRGLRAPLAELPLAQSACASGETYLGVIAPASLGRLAAPLGVTAELMAVLVPIRLGKRPVGLIVGVDLAHAALAHRDDLARLAAKTDHALHIIHLRRQLLAP